jgi:hypothetical protein
MPSECQQRELVRVLADDEHVIREAGKDLCAQIAEPTVPSTTTRSVLCT